MYLPKTDVYNSLIELPYSVAQTQPEIFNELPAIIFSVGNNAVSTDLDGEISSQDIEIQIDIWAEDSVTASTVLSQVEEIMRSNFYIMSFSNDVPNVSNLYHIVSRFAKQI
jgi:hypothetical protein